MPRKPRDVTEAELSVLQLLWERQEATARTLAEELYGGATESNLATVQKLLQRLETKCFVKRSRELRPHVFAPAIGREELVSLRLQSTAEDLCSGSFSPLLTHLVKSRLTRSERQELRDLLEKLEREHSTEQ